jgi:uncharacterized membrane protein
MYSSEEKTWAMLAHLITMICNVMGLGFGWVVGLILFAINPPKSRFVAFHALQASLFQLAIGALVWVCVFTSLLVVPFFLLWVFLAMGFIYPIIGLIRANQGEVWKYPFVGKFAAKVTGV